MRDTFCCLGAHSVRPAVRQSSSAKLLCRLQLAFVGGEQFSKTGLPVCKQVLLRLPIEHLDQRSARKAGKASGRCLETFVAKKS